jgi:hypothetical protein
MALVSVGSQLLPVLFINGEKTGRIDEDGNTR